MLRQITATLPKSSAYDDCLIASCLKGLFKKADKSAPGFIISSDISEVKNDLEQVNKTGISELSYPYLEVLEQTIPGAAFRYVIVYKNNSPVLFAYFQLYNLSSQNFNLERNKGFVKGIFRFFLKLSRIRVLVAGNALRNDNACYCFDESVLNNGEVAQLIVSAAEKIAADECATALILKDIPDSGGIHKWLAGNGYRKPWQDQAMVMDIDVAWGGMADYLTELSRKYKTRAHKILACRSDIVVKPLSEDEIGQHGAVINRLFRNVADNQSFVLTLPGYEHFAALKKVYRDNFEFFGFFHEGKLAGFYSAFISTNAYEVYYVGFDYALNAEYQLYFNMLFSGLERAIELKKKQLKLGRTSFDAKASLGAKPVDIVYFIKTSGITNAVSTWFADYFSSMQDSKWKLRNPLK